MNVSLNLFDEFRLTADQQVSIRQLLHDSFPNAAWTSSRTYGKQLPHRRLLATSKGRLVGHLGLDHRAISIDREPATLLGIIEVCVAADCRGRGIASQMLKFVEDLGRQHHVEFLMLFCTDRRLYEQNGFVHADNRLRWNMIDEHKTIGIDEQPLDELMIKSLTERPWRSGLVDLLGYQF